MVDPLTGERESSTDRALLRAYVRGDARSFQTLVARYEGLVTASAVRRLRADANDARVLDVGRAVFQILSRRAKTLRVRSTLSPWLFEVTRLVCKRMASGGSSGFWSRLRRRFFRENASAMAVAGEDLRERMAPWLDSAIDRLRRAQREVVLLRWQGKGLASTAALLGTTEARVERRMRRALGQISRRLRRVGVFVSATELEEIWAHVGRVGGWERGELLPGSNSCEPSYEPGTSGGVGAPRRPVLPAAACAVRPAAECGPSHSAPGELEQRTLRLAEDGGLVAVGSPSVLVRRVLRTLAWVRWRRRIVIGVPAFFLGAALLIGAWWIWDARDGHSRTLAWFLVWSVKNEAVKVPGLAESARPWRPRADRPRLEAAPNVDAGELYRLTNIWLAHLIIDREEWAAMEPRHIEPLPHFLQPDGTALLRNPKAMRGGLAGVLGYDFHWSRGELEFGGRRFTNVAVRIKGNGTFLGSLYGDKRSFKVDLNRFVRGQKLAGRDELNFHNLVNDYSNLSDALGYEFFREAGVPASRTAYVYLDLTVEGQEDRRPLGLYALVEPVDRAFVEERLGSRRTPLFKPVTYELFRYLGNDWAAYDEIYDLRTDATDAQRRRIIEFSRLVTGASDQEFGTRLGDYLDLDAFARFLAVQVLLSNYDGLLSTGQNFYLYLDPASDRFGFIPWDLDLAWGGFFLLGTDREREQASVWHPWVGANLFLERVFRVDAFRSRYRADLEMLLAGLFQPARLHQRIDALAAVVREPVAAESDFRLRKFEDAVRARPLENVSERSNQGANRPAHQLKRFVNNRADSVRKQLDGKSSGVILQRRPK